MKVKFLEGAGGAGVTYYPGEVHDIPEALARAWIAAGTCEAVRGKHRTIPIERAERAAPEKAVLA